MMDHVGLTLYVVIDRVCWDRRVMLGLTVYVGIDGICSDCWCYGESDRVC